MVDYAGQFEVWRVEGGRVGFVVYTWCLCGTAKTTRAPEDEHVCTGTESRVAWQIRSGGALTRRLTAVTAVALLYDTCTCCVKTLAPSGRSVSSSFLLVRNSYVTTYEYLVALYTGMRRILSF